MSTDEYDLGPGALVRDLGPCPLCLDLAVRGSCWCHSTAEVLSFLRSHGVTEADPVAEGGTLVPTGSACPFALAPSPCALCGDHPVGQCGIRDDR